MRTAKRDERDTILGWELGADDYITQPFSSKALGIGSRKTARPPIERVLCQVPFGNSLAATACQMAR